ncbi:OTU domain-containing protein [Trichinella pseudospiralis]
MHPQQWPAWGRPGAVVFMLAVILFLLIPFAELVAQSRVTQARLRPPHLIDQQLDVTNTHQLRMGANRIQSHRNGFLPKQPSPNA